MTIALIRHGQTNWNLEGRVQGLSNIPLNETGRDQARTAGMRIAEEGSSWDFIVSSPLDRARETAEIIAAHLGLQLAATHEDLVEQNYGEAEGSTISEFSRRWPTREFAGGERDTDVGNRGMRALDELASAYAGARVLAVSHGAYIRRTISVVSGLTYQQVPRIDNAAMSHLDRDNGQAWQVITVGGVPFEQAIGAPLANVEPAAPPFQMIQNNSNSSDGFGVCTVDGVCT